MRDFTKVATALILAFCVGLTACGGGNSTNNSKDTQPPPPVLSSITVTNSSSTVTAGMTAQFSASGKYSDGSTKDLTATATWTSSDNTVATVAAGLVTTLKAGAVTVTATSGSVSGTSQLTVNAAALTAISLKASATTIPLGGTQQIVATGTYNNNAEGPISGATWTSSDPTIIAVDENGVATAKVPSGSVDITASSNGIVSGKLTLTAADAAPKSLFLVPSNPTLAVFQWVKPTVYVLYTDKSVQDVTPIAVLSIDDQNVARLSSSHAGIISGNDPGTAKLSATYESLSASTNVSVSGYLQSLAVSPKTGTVHQGGEILFTATGTFDSGATETPMKWLAWTSSTPAVADFGQGAGDYLNGLAPGTVTVTARDGANGKISDTAAVDVDSFVLQSFSLNATSLDLAVHVTKQLVATGHFSDGTTSEDQVLSNVVWTSSDESVAVVDQNGLVRSVAPGTATITATLPGGQTQSIGATVAHGTMDHIEITGVPATINPGKTAQLKGTVYLTDGRQFDTTTVSIWLSSDANVALVDANGNLIAVNPGTAKITMLFGDQVTAEITVSAAQ